ncbi:MAG: CRTAC1 family protein [Myxococcota bacterium]
MPLRGLASVAFTAALASACGSPPATDEVDVSAGSASSTSGGGSGLPGSTSTSASTADATTSGLSSDATETGDDQPEPATTTSSTTSNDGSSSDDGSTTGGPLAPVALSFTNVAPGAGLDHVHGTLGEAPDCLVDSTAGTGNFCSAQWMTGGFAAGDYDGDGDPDLYVPRTHGGDLLLRNEGDGTFADATELTGLGRVGSGSAAWADVDNDGDQDLYVTAFGGTRHDLYINDGSGHFNEQGLERGAAVATGHPHVPMGIAVGDYDLDGYLDLFVTEWMSDGGVGEHPSHNRLLHNLGDAAPGHFEDVTIAAGVDLDLVWVEADAWPGTWGFAPAFADLDGDRWPELIVTSDFGCSRLFWNDGDGTFTDGTVAAGVGLDDNGMGSTLGDMDGDGDLDWFVTAITDFGGPLENRLYRNDGMRSFTELAEPAGVADGGWGWGATFFDPDLDGDLDLVMASGYYYAHWVAHPNRVWLNDGDGAFGDDVAAQVGLDLVAQSRGLLAFDYDGDGDQDVLVANNAEAPALFRNDSTGPHDWLRVRVQGTTSNADGLGARVRVQAEAGGPWQTREVGSASHFLGQQPKPVHFGIPAGSDPIHEVRVYWPATDTEQVRHDVARSSTLVIVEG